MIQLSSVVLAGPGVITPMVFGAVGNGTTDDHTALQAAANSGFPIFLDRTYGLGSRITWAQDGGGFYSNGTGGINMLTGPGQFTYTSGPDRYGTNGVGILATGFSGMVFRDFKIALVGSPSDDNACTPIAFNTGCSNFKVQGLDISGFKKCQPGLITVNGCNDWEISGNYLHDCHCYGATNGQLTAIGVDNDIPGSTYSTRGKILKNRIVNMLCDATFIAANGYQTDGVNIGKYQTTYIDVIDNTIDSVGEGIDYFGWNGVIANNNVINAYYFGIKQVHGASRNLISNNHIDKPGISGIALGGSSSGSAINVDGNLIIGNRITRVNDANVFAGSTSVAGIEISDIGATISLCTNNIMMDNVVSDSPNSYNAWYDASNASSGNEWYDNRAQGTFANRILTNLNGSLFRKANKSYVSATRITSAQGITNGLATYIFNSELIDVNGEYDPTTGIFTAQTDCRIKVDAQIRSATNGGAATNWSMFAVGPVTIERVNVAYAAGEMCASISCEMVMAVGDTLKIQISQSAGGTINETFGNSALTWLQLSEV